MPMDFEQAKSVIAELNAARQAQEERIRLAAEAKKQLEEANKRWNNNH